MNREQLIDFGAQILAMDRITRWELDPDGDKLEDYIHEDVISLMWDLFNQELSKLGGICNSNIVGLLDEALWEGVNEDIDYLEIISEGREKYSNSLDYAGKSIVDFYKPFVELIVDNAIKIGTILKEKQAYFKKQGQF